MHVPKRLNKTGGIQRGFESIWFKKKIPAPANGKWECASVMPPYVYHV